MIAKRPILSIQRCEAYEPGLIREKLELLLEPFGGWGSLIKPGMRVLVKPNMLSCKSPSACATTHPSIVECVAKRCRELGAEVIIGDSPPLTMGRIEEFWGKTGFKEAATVSGASLVCFEREPTRKLTLEVEDQKVDMHVTEEYYRADLVINISKMKTHNLTTLTGAVKNLFGLLPGLQKAGLHMRFARPEPFSELIVKIATVVPAGLNIMDAVEGMDGQGPASGRVIKPGILLASDHPVPIDLAFCEIAGIKPAQVHTLSKAIKAGFGPTSLEGVSIFGPDPKGLRYEGFDVPGTPLGGLFPEPLVGIARKLLWARPRLIPAGCIKCGACKGICPADAILMGDSGPQFNRPPCISCFCCMEVCPVDVIEMEVSLILKCLQKLNALRKRVRF